MSGGGRDRAELIAIILGVVLCAVWAVLIVVQAMG